MNTNLKIVRYIAFSLEIILLAVLQSTPKLMPELFGSKPVLLLAAALSIAAFEDLTPSLIFGAVCGVLCDLASSGGVGFFAIALTLACYTISYLFQTRLRSNFVTLMTLSFAAVVMILGIYFLLFRLFWGVPDAGTLFVNHYLSRMAYTIVCAAPLYFLNLFLYRSFC